MNLKKPSFLILMSSMLSFAAEAQTQTASFFNDRVSLQGYLKSSGGALNDLSGFPMKFVIKRNSTPVWCQAISAPTPVVGGVFSAVLTGTSNCDSQVSVLSPAVFTHEASTDIFTIDVTVDTAKDGFGGADDATFAGIDLMSAPLSMYAHHAQTADSLSGVVSVDQGGTGATSAAEARANLGLGPLATLALSGNPTDVLRGDGTFAPSADLSSATLNGDVSGSLASNVVNRIKGRSVSSATPSAGQVLTWNSATSSWEPQTPAAAPVVSVAGRTGNVTLSSADILDASSANSADTLVRRDASGNFAASVISANITGTAANVTGVVAVSNGGTGAVGLGSGQLIVSNGAGTALEPMNCMMGQVLRFGPLGSVQCENVNVAGGLAQLNSSAGLSLAGDLDMGPSHSFLLSNNSTDPQNLTGADRGRVWYNTNLNQIRYFDGNSIQTLNSSGPGMTSLNGSTVSTQIFGTPGTAGAAPNWTTVANAGVHTLHIPMASSPGVTAGLISKSDYDAFVSKLGTAAMFGGDVSGNYNNLSVERLKGRMVSSAAPSSGQVLTWNASSSAWEPQTLSAAGTGVTSVAGRTGDVVLVSADITDASAAAGASTVVRRDAAGNFAAGMITANVTGNVTGNVSGTAANVTGVVDLAHGGTGATTPAAARLNLGAAASGANTDITSINGSSRQASQTTAPQTAGTAGSYTLTFSPAVGSLSVGQTIFFRVHAVNTAGATLNVDGLGGRAMVSNFTGASLNAGDLQIGKVQRATYDGVNFVVDIPPHFYSVNNLNCGNNIAAGSSANCPAISASSVAAGDVVSCSPSADPGSAGVTWSAIASSGSITIRLACSNGNSQCNLTARAWKCRVQK